MGQVFSSTMLVLGSKYALQTWHRNQTLFPTELLAPKCKVLKGTDFGDLILSGVLVEFTYFIWVLCTC